VSGLTPEIVAELNAALIPLRAEGLTSEQAAARLPKHLVQPFWERQVDRYLTEELAKLDAADAEREGTTMSTMIRVEVREDTETLATTVSRDCPDGWFELPEELVVQFERARNARHKAEDAISAYIAEHGLEVQYGDG
jgi:hypothetical protein